MDENKTSTEDGTSSSSSLLRPSYTQLWPSDCDSSSSSDLDTDVDSEAEGNIDGKSIRESLNNMTRNDLQELVLKKVVEGKMVKRKFAYMRRQLNKYGKKIATYRRNINKQFLHLEVAHNRLLMDLETKNACFTAPVRVTREVGTQVGETLEPSTAEPSAGDQINVADIRLAAPSIASFKAIMSSMRAPLQTITQKQQQHHPKQSQQQSLLKSSSVSYNQSTAPTATEPPLHRGGNQVNSQNNNSLLRTLLSENQRPMHASEFTGSTASAVANRNRSPCTPQKQQALRPILINVGSMDPKRADIVFIPVSPTISGGPDGTAVNYGQQQPNKAQAEPKEKAVIDLTDVIDAATAMTAKAAAVKAYTLLRQSYNRAMKRNYQGTTTPAPRVSGESGRTPASGNVGNLPLQMPVINARQIDLNNDGDQGHSFGSNLTIQIRSENKPPAATRLWYSHPPPLPSSPAQPCNPGWKLPPSRLLIRVDFKETRIDICWVPEQSSNRFADSVRYQVYAYEETLNEPSSDSWMLLGDVPALQLPMIATIAQFKTNQRYYFAVRGMDAHQRFGSFSVPKTWP